jgi:hypothetical protein
MARPRRKRAAPAPKRRTPLDWIRQAPKLASSIGAVIGVIAAALALFTNLFPGCERNPPAPRTSSEILEVIRDPNVRLGDFRRRLGLTPGQFPGDGRAVGNQFTVRIETKGFYDKGLPLRWTMFDADSDSVLSDERFDNQLAAKFKPKSARPEGQTGSVRVWIPLPRGAGSYFVRFDLYDDQDALLDTADDTSFRVAG